MTVMQRVRGTERRARRAIRPDPGPDRTRECPGESADARMVVRLCETGYGEGILSGNNRDKYRVSHSSRSLADWHRNVGLTPPA